MFDFKIYSKWGLPAIPPFTKSKKEQTVNKAFRSGGLLETVTVCDSLGKQVKSTCFESVVIFSCTSKAVG